MTLDANSPSSQGDQTVTGLNLRDESIDLGRSEPPKEGSSALSFSDQSGSSNGGPSSGVRSWRQLVAETAPASDASTVCHSRIVPHDENETDSDKNVLREVLADEPPPSNIVLKDPSITELKFPSMPDLEAAFSLPPDLAAIHPENSSVLSSFVQARPGQSGINSDIWGPSSRVDLFRSAVLPELANLSHRRTDKREYLPPTTGSEADSDHAYLATPPENAVHDESSAVDLGSRAVIDLPFPLGLSSMVARAALGSADVTVPARRFPLIAWIGGGVAGLLLGFAAAAGFWFAGLAPDHSRPPAPPPKVAAGPGRVDLANWAAQLRATNKVRDDETKKAAAAITEAEHLRDQLARTTVQLTQATAAAAQVKEMRDRANSLATQLTDAESKRAKMEESIEKLSTGKATSDAKLRQSEANLAALRDRLARAETKAKGANERLASAEAARTQSATLATGPILPAPAQPAIAVPAPEQLQSSAHAGFQALRNGDYLAAEHEFARLAQSPKATAIHLYYLGLAQWRLGQTANAEASFHRGWELERASRPPPGEVEAAFERLDRADRDAVNQYRR